MRALAATALTLAFATPAAAAAETVARRTPVVGPVFAGDAVAWGEESRGATRVMVGSPGREPVLVHRVRPATARKTDRSFSGVQAAFAASASGFAALISTSTVVFEESDSFTSATTEAAIGGPFRGPVGILAGCIPRRGDIGCGEPCALEHGVDVDGTRIAVASSVRPCDADEMPRRHTITVFDGPRRTTVTGGEGSLMFDVELAGRYVAWIEETLRGARHVLVVHDLDRGTDVLRVSNRDLDARVIDDIALADDGTVAAVFSGRRDRRGARLGLMRPGTPGVRLIARHANWDVAMAGGRVLYEQLISARRNESALVLHSLADERETILARLHARRRLTGDFDLDATRATWAELPTRRGYEPTPRGRARIIVRSL